MSVVIVLIVVGILLYCINQFVPMEARVKSILNIVVILVLVWWLLTIFGIFGYLGNVTVPRVR